MTEVTRVGDAGNGAVDEAFDVADVAEGAAELGAGEGVGVEAGDAVLAFAELVEVEEGLAEPATEEAGAHDLLHAPCPLPDGPAWSFLTAGSSLRLVKALFGGTPRLLHAPAPGGLPGGYPVLVSSGKMDLAPIEGLTFEEALAINEASHPFDGIEEIAADGTATFTGTTAGIMREELGFDCPGLHPAEAEERGRELIRRFREYAVRHGVNLP